ncbi:PREDICTED: uncharacterized protein LOC108567321 [Nicrophorus vespilloides]|uniref:Uncharacterized protein LOC108567321 n=1 Tax=Nicrophorus vespilloides TaxID=110193 RepID=A0ABM1N8P8_NICVS|nr:PREDICTED: uncharacterized protein LOC108567321 [Nicrophorus vespilloides]
MTTDRPCGGKYPNIWREFEGRERDGFKRKYWVQDLTEEHFDAVIKVLFEGFVSDEPLCKFLKITEDEEALAEMKELYLDTLRQKYGLICFTKDNDGTQKLVGFNCTSRRMPNDRNFECSNEKVKLFLEYEDKYIPGYKQQMEKLNIKDYLSAVGLFVLPEYRGESIGLQILKAREPLCKARGINISVTLFTSIASQKLAVKAGYIDLMPEDAPSYTPANKDEEYLTELAKGCRFMYIFY